MPFLNVKRAYVDNEQNNCCELTNSSYLDTGEDLVEQKVDLLKLSLSL